MNEILSDEIMAHYEEAMNETMERLNIILKSFLVKNSTFGYYICGRTKDLKRVEEKLKRKHNDKIDYDVKFVMNTVTDIAGVRIIFGPEGTSFNIKLLNMTLRDLTISDFEALMKDAVIVRGNNDIDIIYKFVDELRNSGFNVVPNKTKDYITNPKDSGYMSYHVTVIASNGLPVEIQLRNFLQHLYAEAEHKRYESDSNDEKANAILAECASYLRRSDDSYSSGRSL